MGNYKRNQKFNKSNHLKSSHAHHGKEYVKKVTKPTVNKASDSTERKYKVHLTMNDIRMLIECLDESYNIVQEELEYEHREGGKPDKEYVAALFRDEEKIKSLLIKFDSIYYSEKTAYYKDYVDSLESYSYDLSSKNKT